MNTATRRKPSMREFRILQNISGAFLPGRVTLLLGPPGGGKTMLMKACCGAAPVQVWACLPVCLRSCLQGTCAFVSAHYMPKTAVAFVSQLAPV